MSTQLRCAGGGRWRQVDGQVVATPGLIGPGISTRPCGWIPLHQADPADQARTECPWCGGRIGWRQPYRPGVVLEGDRPGWPGRPEPEGPAG